MKKTLVLTVLSLSLGNIGTHSAQAQNLTVSQAFKLKHKMLVSKHTEEWYLTKGHWTLHRRFKTCKAVAQRYSAHRGDVCYKARMALARHTARYNRIHAILYPPPVKDWLRDALLCIHGYEGAWNSNTGNGYYGGLQMDWGFMRAYGSEYIRRYGSANNWPVEAQIAAGKKAYSSGRGFNPWPNTAAACGLS